MDIVCLILFGHNESLYLSLRSKSQTLVRDLFNMQNALNHISDWSSHLTCKCRKKIFNFQRLVHGSYYTALSYDVIHDILVLFT